MGKLDIFNIRLTSKKIHRRDIMFKLSSVVALVAILMLLVFYGFFSLANDLGYFTVRLVDESDTYLISISESSSFENPTTMLNADGIEEMDNISEYMLPSDIDSIDGPHNGKDYIAYTFYLKNLSKKPIDYIAEIKILSVDKGADEAIRVKVYKNGVPVTYAKNQKNTDIPEPNTTPFYSSSMVMSQVNEDFMAGDIDKYTIVIWLEGNDPECIDDIKGGHVRMVMNLDVVHD